MRALRSRWTCSMCCSGACRSWSRPSSGSSAWRLSLLRTSTPALTLAGVGYAVAGSAGLPSLTCAYARAGLWWWWVLVSGRRPGSWRRASGSLRTGRRSSAPIASGRSRMGSCSAGIVVRTARSRTTPLLARARTLGDGAASCRIPSTTLAPRWAPGQVSRPGSQGQGFRPDPAAFSQGLEVQPRPPGPHVSGRLVPGISLGQGPC